MSLEAHIRSVMTPAQPIAFEWTDWDAREYYMFDPPEDFAPDMGPSAVLALILGTATWIRLRFESFDADPLPGRVEGAGWAYQVNPGAAAYFELPLDDWRGPVRGPLGLVIDLILDALFVRDEDPEIEVRLMWIYNLAIHVLEADADAFVGWFAERAEMLAAAYPNGARALPLFGDDPTVGPPVAPDALVPQERIDIADAERRLRAHVHMIAGDNPLIATELV